jgi:hypothetical protein
MEPMPPTLPSLPEQKEISKENLVDKNQNNTDDDNNILSGDNKIDVDIKPDVKDNVVPIQVCSCSLNIIFNCFSK